MSKKLAEPRQKKSPKVDLNQALTRARAIVSDFEELRNDLEGERFVRLNLLDLTDRLNDLKLELHSKMDGRPQPLTLAEASLSAECFEPGFNEKAAIGATHLTLSELIQLKQWIAEVIAWHQQHPEPIKI